jgi:hypothetical protein
VNFVLEEEVRMNKVVAMFEMELVGRFHGRRLWERFLREWIISN